METPHVVIIGGGFGGLACARKLGGAPVRVTLVDRNNYHLFTPLLYQVASSLLNPGDIARPIRSIVRRGNVRYRQADVTGVDFARRTVLTREGDDIPYDFLVIAAGSTTNYFGNDSIARNALGLKDLPEALELRNHILQCLESATQATPADADAWLTFVVAGGGPTGVEYAGALSELVRLVLPEEYPELGQRDLRIVLVEGLDDVLPPFPSSLRREAHRELTRKGIEVRTGLRVGGFEDGTVRLSNGESIAAKTLVWAAGVRPNALAEALDVSRSASGRVVVDGALRLPAHPEVMAIGDVASFVQDGKEVPMLSAPAMQQGRTAAENILRAIAGRPPRRFHYRDKGSMATIGKASAVAELGCLRLKGFIGWVAWLVVHLYYIIGFRNRLIVLASWAWNYLRSDRPVRIITRAARRIPGDGASGG